MKHIKIFYLLSLIYFPLQSAPNEDIENYFTEIANFSWLAEASIWFTFWLIMFLKINPLLSKAIIPDDIFKKVLLEYTS